MCLTCWRIRQPVTKCHTPRHGRRHRVTAMSLPGLLQAYAPSITCGRRAAGIPPAYKSTQVTPLMKLIRKLVSAVLCSLLLATAGLARERKLSSELNEHLDRFYSNAAPPQTAETVEVIIQFRRGASSPTLLSKVKGIGGTHRNTLDVIHGGLFRVPVDLLPLLAQDPDITYISPDRQTFN